MELLKDEEINNYILACQAKSQKCNIHFALTHLAANKYSIKTALETFDRKFCGKNLSEFWTSDELKTFVRIMNNKNNHKQKSYKNMHKISKNIPNKSTGDVVNAYYALKKNICSFGRVFTICPEIIKGKSMH
uniref:SANT domain-containing protein n=1 Tax=Panagrolaimus superbus TaxID=310955 RepID=A0A914XYL7_9BILA